MKTMKKEQTKSQKLKIEHKHTIQSQSQHLITYKNQMD